METLEKTNKQKPNKQKPNNKNGQFAHRPRKRTKTRKLLRSRYKKACFVLRNMEKSRRNGKIPENYETVLRKWQAVKNEYLEDTALKNAKAQRAKTTKETLRNDVVITNTDSQLKRPVNDIIKDKLCMAIANDIDGYIKPIDKTDWPMIELKLAEILQQRFSHGRATVPRYDTGEIYGGFCLIQCSSKWSKQLLANSVGRIRNWFEGKQLTLIPAAQIPSILSKQNIDGNNVQPTTALDKTSGPDKLALEQYQTIQISVNNSDPMGSRESLISEVNMSQTREDIEKASCNETPEQRILRIRDANIRREQYYKCCQRYLEQMANLRGLTQSQRRRKKKAMKFIKQYERFQRRDRTICGVQRQTSFTDIFQSHYEPKEETNQIISENFSSGQLSPVSQIPELSSTKEDPNWLRNDRDPKLETRDNFAANSYRSAFRPNDRSTIEMSESSLYQSNAENFLHDRTWRNRNDTKATFSSHPSYSAPPMEEEPSMRNERSKWSRNSRDPEMQNREDFVASLNERCTLAPERMGVSESSRFNSNVETSMYERRNRSRNNSNNSALPTWQASMNNEFLNRPRNETEMRQRQRYDSNKMEHSNERQPDYGFPSGSTTFFQPETPRFSQQHSKQLESVHEAREYLPPSRQMHEPNSSYSRSYFKNFPSQFTGEKNLLEEGSLFHRRDYPNVTQKTFTQQHPDVEVISLSDDSKHGDDGKIRSISAEDARNEYLEAVDYLRKMQFRANDSLNCSEKLKLEICHLRIINYEKRFGYMDQEIINTSVADGGHREERSRRPSYRNTGKEQEPSLQPEYDTLHTSLHHTPHEHQQPSGRSLTRGCVNPDLEVAFIDRNQLDGKISNGTWAEIEQVLLQHLAQEIQQTNNPNIGKFHSGDWRYGIKIIQCENVESMEFIRRFIRNQNIYWPNTQFDVIPARELPKRSVVKVWIPPPIRDDMTILHSIKAQNFRFDSVDWTLVDSRQRRNGNGKDLYISISSTSLARLRETHGEIRFGKKRLQMVLPHTA